MDSGVATGGGHGGQSATPDSEKFAKKREKIRENREKRGKIGKVLKLPLLTDRASYAILHIELITTAIFRDSRPTFHGKHNSMISTNSGFLSIFVTVLCYFVRV